MKKNKYVLLVFIVIMTVISFQGCGSSLKEEQQAERQKINQLLYQFYARDFPLFVSRFTNRSKHTNFAYLEEAIPEIVAIVLQSMEKDYTLIDGWEYVRLRGFPVALEQQLVSTKIASWDEYRLLVPMMITQVRIETETNGKLIMTNMITNVQSTNVLRFKTNTYETFLRKEFPMLVESISRLPVRWQIEELKKSQTNNKGISFFVSSSTNQAQIEWLYEGSIQGWFSAGEGRIGPSEIELHLFLTKIKAFWTNQIHIVVKTTEDKLYEEIVKKSGQIRRFYLEGDLVDVEVMSRPDGAQVYFDGVYVGRTPLLYEGVRTGKHRVYLVKEGFDTAHYLLEVKPDATNLVLVDLQARNMTGVVSLQGESNRLVFLDSLYVGTTPLMISNVSLHESHVLLVRSGDRNYEDLYYTFTLTSEKPLLVFSVGKGKFRAQREWEKNQAWVFCYTSWGLTIGLIGAHFYTSSLARYYQDQLYNSQLTSAQRQAYTSETAFYLEWQQRFFSYGILSSLVSLGFTAYALFQEHIYVNYNPATQQVGLLYETKF